jgi:hypothetical protein
MQITVSGAARTARSIDQHAVAEPDTGENPGQSGARADGAWKRLRPIGRVRAQRHAAPATEVSATARGGRCGQCWGRVSVEAPNAAAVARGHAH